MCIFIPNNMDEYRVGVYQYKASNLMTCMNAYIHGNIEMCIYIYICVCM